MSIDKENHSMYHAAKAKISESFRGHDVRVPREVAIDCMVEFARSYHESKLTEAGIHQGTVNSCSEALAAAGYQAAASFVLSVKYLRPGTPLVKARKRAKKNLSDCLKRRPLLSEMQGKPFLPPKVKGLVQEIEAFAKCIENPLLKLKETDLFGNGETSEK